MFDKDALVDGSLRNVTRDGAVAGYAVDARIPYYRGLGLSMVEVDLTVDSQSVPRELVTFTVHGNSYRSDQLGEVLDDRWPFTEAATLTVARAGGLPAGTHDIALRIHLAVAYIPVGFNADIRKDLEVA